MTSATTTTPTFHGFWRASKRHSWQRLVSAGSFDDAWGQLLDAVADKPRGGETLVSTQDLDQTGGRQTRRP
jgi:hypothetical protein